MGACVSVHKDTDSTMRLRLSFGSKTDKLVIPSPVKDKPLVNGDRLIAVDGGLKSPWSTTQPATTARDLGSREETFFDSQPWLESDCEDDYFSVNGDFTPSRGSTPVHHSFAAGTPRINEAHLDEKKPDGSKPEPSPRKRLSEFFQNSLGGDKDFDDLNILGNQKVLNGKTEAKGTVDGTPFASGANSVCSSERTPNGGKEKQIKSMQCCLPRMLSCRSFSERKKMMSPARSIG